MTLQEEEYIHFVSSIEDLNRAWGILQEIRKSKDSKLVRPAFQFALIEYSKPYVSSYGTAKKCHKLKDDYVPAKYHELHRRILTMRDQILAHSDLTVKEASLYVSKTASGKYPPAIVQNVIDPTELFSKIDVIIELIEQTLNSMYEKVKVLEAALSINTE